MKQDEELKILVGNMVIPPSDAARKATALKSALTALESQATPPAADHLQAYGGVHSAGNPPTPPQQQ